MSQMEMKLEKKLIELERKLKTIDGGGSGGFGMPQTQSEVNYSLFGAGGPQARAGRMSSTIEERLLANGMYDVNNDT